MGIGPVESTRKLLKRLNLTMDKIDLVEGNEAFAVQSIVVQQELGIPEKKLNVDILWAHLELASLLHLFTH